MIITLQPQRRDDALHIVKEGDALLVNGMRYAFAQMQNGDTLPASAIDCPMLAGDVERSDGELHIALLLPVGPEPSPEAAEPGQIRVQADGPIALPDQPDDDSHVSAPGAIDWAQLITSDQRAAEEAARNNVSRINRRQGRIALIREEGITEVEIQALIDAIDDPRERSVAIAEYENQYWEIDSPWIRQFAESLEITPKRLQELFNIAATL